MKNYVVFKEEMFVARVRMCIEIFAKEFDVEIKNPSTPIPIRISNRMTRGLGKHTYKGNQTKELVFSSHLLDGRFVLDSVDDVVKHECIHYLIFQKTGKSQGRNAMFHKWCDMAGCGGTSGCKMVKSELYYELGLNEDYKYAIKCEKCGSLHTSDRLSKSIKHPSHYTCGEKFNGSVCKGSFVRVK